MILIILTILVSISGAIVSVIFILQKLGIMDLIKHMSLSKDTKETLKNEEYLFERGYYKDISSKEIADMLGKWSQIIIEPENSVLISGTESKMKKELAKAHTEILMYCSNETIELLSEMQQLAYSQQEGSHEMVFIYSLLVSNIRYDYSGLFLDPLTLLKIKLADVDLMQQEDWSSLENKYKKYFRNTDKTK